MKKVVVLVLIIAFAFSMSAVALAAGSPVAGTVEITEGPDGVADIQSEDLFQDDDKRLALDLEGVKAEEKVEGVPVFAKDITLVDADGNPVEGEATLSLPVENLTDDAVVTVICYKDGVPTIVECTVKDGMVEFTADFPCTIVILVDSDPGAESPSTGSDSLTTILLIAACVVLAALAIVVNRKRLQAE